MKVKINLVFVAFLLLFSFPNLYAGEVGNDLAKQGDCIQLTNSCSSCSYDNVSSIKYPNQSYALLGEYAMTKNGTAYNYTYCDTELLGTYEWCSHGDVDGTDTSICLRFDVTPSGFTGTLGFYILIFVLSFGVILLGFYIEDNWVIMFGSMGLYFIGLYILFYGIDGMKDAAYTYGLGIITLMMAAYFSIRAGYEALAGM